MERKIQWVLFIFKEVSFQLIDIIEPIIVGLRYRGIRVCPQQILNVGVRDEKAEPRIKRRKTSSDRLHVRSAGRHVFGRQERLPTIEIILHIHEKFQVNGVY